MPLRSPVLAVCARERGPGRIAGEGALGQREVHGAFGQMKGMLGGLRMDSRATAGRHTGHAREGDNGKGQQEQQPWQGGAGLAVRAANGMPDEFQLRELCSSTVRLSSTRR